MKRIILHWTAGTYKANSTDKQHYHYIIEGDGTVVTGKFPPEANLKTLPGHYAAHTRNCNTGAIGVSLACMAGAVENPFKAGKYPMTKIQWDRMIDLVADLARKYRIPVEPHTILSHAEVQVTLAIPQAGKWDFTRLAFEPSIKGAREIGNLLRAEVRAAMAPAPAPVAVQPPSTPKAAPVPPKPSLPPMGPPAPSLWVRFTALFKKG